MKEFIDREEELKAIKEKLESNKKELILIYGRRRIGKTKLVLKSLENKEYIYFLATEKENLIKFKREASKKVEEVEYAEKDWEAIFNFLKDRIIVIDEFPNLISEDRKVLSTFQKIYDVLLENTKTKIILLGSSISMMKSRILTYKSPLYGRASSILKLNPLKFFQIKDFFENVDSEELVRIYGFADGIPYYLRKIDKLPFFDWLEEELKKPDTFLKHEIDILLRVEFEDPSTYKEILQAIALGKTRLNEIKDAVGIRGEITNYLKNLLNVEFVERVVPITESEKSKKGRYYLKDNFLNFWFKFIYPNLSSIEEGIFDVKVIEREYDSYLGLIFEKICKQYIVELIKRRKLPPFEKIGKYWGIIPKERQSYEIDIVGLNRATKEILFSECKWKENVDAEKICEELERKSSYVEWYKKGRKEYFVVFAKSFSRRIEDFEGRKVLCVELEEMVK